MRAAITRIETTGTGARRGSLPRAVLALVFALAAAGLAAGVAFAASSDFASPEFDWVTDTPHSYRGNTFDAAADHTGMYTVGRTEPTGGGNLVTVRKYGLEDGQVQWTRTFGDYWNWADGVALASGNVYVAGNWDGYSVSFVRGYDTDGNLMWEDTLVGPDPTPNNGYDNRTSYDINGVSADDSGVYVTGNVSGCPDAPDNWNTCFSDGLVRKYDHDGKEVWSENFNGGWGSPQVVGVAVNSAGVYVTGLEGSRSGQDSWVATINKDTGAETNIDNFGDAGTDRAYAIAANSTGAYVTGYSEGDIVNEDGPVGYGSTFVRKYDARDSPEWTDQLDPARMEWNPGNWGRDIAVDDYGVYVLGQTAARYKLPDSEHNGNVFVRKYSPSGALGWMHQFDSDWNIGFMARHGGASYLAGGFSYWGDERDIAGKMTEDLKKPTGTIDINSGATATNKTYATLGLSATDEGKGVTEMRFSDDGTTWEAWTQYQTSQTRTLPSGDGMKTVYVQYRDLWGNVSETASDTIVLDTATPEAVTDVSATPGNTEADLSWTNPTASDFDRVRVLRSTSDAATSPDPTSDQTQVYEGDAASYSDTGLTNGTRYYYTVFVRDEAGNWSSAASTSVTPEDADTTPPTVSLTSPASGATVSGSSVTLSADASDDKGVTRVDFYVNGALVSGDTSAGGTGGKEYSVSWDSTSVSDGQQTIEARAYDAANNEKVSSSRIVDVSNDDDGDDDTTAPTVSMTAPTEDATVSGSSVALKAEATDDKGVARVDFYVDGSKVGTDTTADGSSGEEFTATWDSTSSCDCEQILWATAYDAAGNEGISSQRTVTVDNGGDDDTTAPTVASSDPSPGQTKVRRATYDITAQFSEEIDQETLNSNNVQLYVSKKGKLTRVSALVTPGSDGQSVTLSPLTKLGKNKQYVVVLWKNSIGIKDLAENPLAAEGGYQESEDGEYIYYGFRTGKK